MSGAGEPSASPTEKRKPAVWGERRELQPTGRLAFWFAIASLGLLLEPILPGASWLTLAGDTVLLGLVWRDRTMLSQARDVTAKRERDPIFSLGAENPVRVTVTNRSTIPFAMELVDEPPVPFKTDRDSFRVMLEGGTRWEGTYHTTPARRGDYEFGGLNLRLRSPLGILMCYQRVLPADVGVRVYPNLRDSKTMALLAMRDMWASMGIRIVRSLEAGREFESLREYQVGDEYRTMDWKATARHGRLIVRQYDMERSQKVLLVLDLGRTMTSRLGDLTKADLAINACVLLASVAARMDDRVGVLAFADRVLGFHPPTRGPHQAARLLEFLYPLEAVTRESDYSAAFHETARRLQSRTLVILFTDLVDPESSSHLISQLGVLARKHSVLCVALADYELDRVLHAPVGDATGLYRQAVAQALLEDRDQAAARMMAQGVGVMKASPEHLSVQVVNRYLGYKATGRVTGGARAVV